MLHDGSSKYSTTEFALPIGFLESVQWNDGMERLSCNIIYTFLSTYESRIIYK